jgi:hypothetical protein
MAWSQAGFYMTPSFAVAELYDDNIFRTSSRRKGDFIARFTPGFQGGYQSEPFTLLGNYSFSSEVFAQNPSQTKAEAFQTGGVQIEYQPTRLWTLEFIGQYLDTERPEDINLTNGIEDGRGRSRSYSFEPSLTYRCNALTTAIARYSFSRNERDKGSSDVGFGGTTDDTQNDTHTAAVELARQLSTRHTAAVSYIFRRFRSSGGSRPQDVGTNEHETSYAMVMEWRHQLAASSTLTLRGGPRFSTGDVEPEVEGSISHQFRRGQVKFTYGRTQNTAVGLRGIMNTESFIGHIEYQLLQHLFLEATPGFYRNNGNGFKAKVYRLDLSLVYQINQWLSLRGSYRFGYEDESGGGSGGSGRGDRYLNVVMLEVSVTYPFRLY